MDTNFSDIIIYTSTFYEKDETSKIRSELCLGMLKNAQALGVRVIIKDTGSNEEFIRKVKRLNNVTLLRSESTEQRKNMGEDRRDALKVAISIAKREKIKQPYFLWTEPEKDNFISAENLLTMASEMKRGTNIVIPARKEKALESLPKNQRWFEQRGNKRALEVIRQTSDNQGQELLDLWFGPKMFDFEGAQYFINYNQKNNRIDLWDAVTVPVAEAIRDGKKAVSVPVDYEYHESQRNNESGELKDGFTRKRLEQYAQILKEMGDKKWTDFFAETKEELKKINELSKEKNSMPKNQELLNEAKRSTINKFFR